MDPAGRHARDRSDRPDPTDTEGVCGSIHTDGPGTHRDRREVPLGGGGPSVSVGSGPMAPMPVVAMDYAPIPASQDRSPLPESVWPKLLATYPVFFNRVTHSDSPHGLPQSLWPSPLARWEVSKAQSKQTRMKDGNAKAQRTRRYLGWRSSRRLCAFRTSDPGDEGHPRRRSPLHRGKAQSAAQCR
jgi:hypothetical protein